MSFSLQITTKDNRKLAKGLNELQDKFGRAGRKSMMKATMIQLRGWVGKNFQKEGGEHKNSSLKWKGLSPVTIANRRQKSSVILNDTGQLRNKWKVRATSNSGVLQSEQNYSSIHEDGGVSTITHRYGVRLKNPVTINVPQRKIFPDKSQADQIILSSANAFINHAVRKYLK